MKKVLFMLSSMNIGGVEKSLLSLLSTMSPNKYEITLLLLEKNGGFLKNIPTWVKVEEAQWFREVKPIIMEAPKKIILDFLKKKQLQSIPGYLTSYLISKHFNNRLQFYRKAMNSVPHNENMYDIAIAFQGPTDIIDFYIIKKVKAKKKISWIHFDVSNHHVNQKLYNRLYPFFDELFIVSEEAKKQLIRKFPNVVDKVKVVPNKVSKSLIKKMSEEKAEFDKEYNGWKIVTVGRLSEEKGQDLAVTVLSKLLKDGIDVRWYCIGEGKFRKNLEIMIKENKLENNFILLGSSDNPYPYIAQADIYVQTSRHEGFCLTLAEAISLSKPIVTTNFVGAYEQIENGVNGLIVSTNEEEIYQKVKLLIENKQIREKFVKSLISESYQKEFNMTCLKKGI